jgi:hypothetical protein
MFGYMQVVSNMLGGAIKRKAIPRYQKLCTNEDPMHGVQQTPADPFCPMQRICVLVTRMRVKTSPS